MDRPRTRQQILGRQALPAEDGLALLSLEAGSRPRYWSEHHQQTSNVKFRVEKHSGDHGVLDTSGYDEMKHDEARKQEERQARTEWIKVLQQKVQQRASETYRALKKQQAVADDQALTAQKRMLRIKAFSDRVTNSNLKRGDRKDQDVGSPSPRDLNVAARSPQRTTTTTHALAQPAATAPHPLHAPHTLEAAQGGARPRGSTRDAPHAAQGEAWPGSSGDRGQQGGTLSAAPFLPADAPQQGQGAYYPHMHNVIQGAVEEGEEGEEGEEEEGGGGGGVDLDREASARDWAAPWNTHHLWPLQDVDTSDSDTWSQCSSGPEAGSGAQTTPPPTATAAPTPITSSQAASAPDWRLTTAYLTGHPLAPHLSSHRPPPPLHTPPHAGAPLAPHLSSHGPPDSLPTPTDTICTLPATPPPQGVVMGGGGAAEGEGAAGPAAQQLLELTLWPAQVTRTAAPPSVHSGRGGNSSSSSSDAGAWHTGIQSAGSTPAGSSQYMLPAASGPTQQPAGGRDNDTSDVVTFMPYPARAGPTRPAQDAQPPPRQVPLDPSHAPLESRQAPLEPPQQAPLPAASAAAATAGAAAASGGCAPAQWSLAGAAASGGGGGGAAAAYPGGLSSPPLLATADAARARLLLHAGAHSRWQQGDLLAGAGAGGERPGEAWTEDGDGGVGAMLHAAPRVVRVFNRQGKAALHHNVQSRARGPPAPSTRALPAIISLDDTSSIIRARNKAAELRVVLPPLCGCASGLSVFDPQYTSRCVRNCALWGRPDMHEALLSQMLHSHGVI